MFNIIIPYFHSHHLQTIFPFSHPLLELDYAYFGGPMRIALANLCLQLNVFNDHRHHHRQRQKGKYLIKYIYFAQRFSFSAGG